MIAMTLMKRLVFLHLKQKKKTTKTIELAIFLPLLHYNGKKNINNISIPNPLVIHMIAFLRVCVKCRDVNNENWTECI